MNDTSLYEEVPDRPTARYHIPTWADTISCDHLYKLAHQYGDQQNVLNRYALSGTIACNPYMDRRALQLTSPDRYCAIRPCDDRALVNQQIDSTTVRKAIFMEQTKTKGLPFSKSFCQKK